MNILILCFCALVATIAAWLYLSVQERELKAETDANGEAEENGESAKEDTAKPAACGSALTRPAGRRLAYLIGMLAVLCMLGVWLETTYRNGLIENARLIVLLALLFVAGNIDARQKIIPNALILAGLGMRVVFWCLELIADTEGFWTILKDDLMGCALVIVFFVIGVLLIRGGIGMGDIKLMLVMSLFQGISGVVSALFCALFVAFVYAIIVLIMRKKTKKDSVAFGPAILVGTVISIFLTGM